MFVCMSSEKGGQAGLRLFSRRNFHFWEGCRLRERRLPDMDKGGQLTFCRSNHGTTIARRNHTRGQRRSLVLDRHRRDFEPLPASSATGRRL